jgi:DNA-binding NtrC family response regulator
LYFRLNVINLRLPPLIRRPEDIPLLARYFLEHLNQENREFQKHFCKKFEERLLACEWKGNVRELKNIVERCYYLSSGVYIDNLEVLAMETEEKVQNHMLEGETLRDLEKSSIEQALFLNKGNAVKAAEDLSISRATIYRKIKAYDIHVGSN